MKKRAALLVGLLLLPLTVLADPATLTKGETLRAKPFSDAKSLAALKKGESVDLLGREGGWYKIQTKSVSGYVPMLSVRKTGAAAAVSAGSLSNVASGRAGTGKVVATTGIRGLNEEQMKEATFSETAIAAAEKNRVGVDEARDFAQSAGLSERQVPPLVVKKKGK